jgi:hypothetical protein
MKKGSDEYWMLIDDLDGRYQKRKDTEVPIRPVPDTTFRDGGGSDWARFVYGVVMFLAGALTSVLVILALLRFGW